MAGLGPVVEHGVEERHLWAIDDDIVLRMASDVGDAGSASAKKAIRP